MNIKLRNFTLNDISRLVKIANNRSVSQNMRDAFPFPYTEKDAEKVLKTWISGKPNTVFAIEKDGVYVGNVGLHIQEDVKRNTVELGYIIDEEYWNQGIASEAVKQIIEFGFSNLNIVRIFASVFEYNIASQKVLINNGFEKEGIAKSAVFKMGKNWDEHLFGLVK